MPETESPQIRWDRVSALIVAALLCLSLPSVVVLVYDVKGQDSAVVHDSVRREPLIGLLITGLGGALLPFLYWAPYRSLGLTGYAATGWLAASIYGVATGCWPGWAHGLCIGIMIGAITRSRRGSEPPEETYWLVGAVVIGTAVAQILISTQQRPYTWVGYYVLAVAAFLFLVVWRRLFRPTFELTLEPVVWVLYRIYGRGDGLKNLPRTGSCIVIANHACWLDPLFLAKVLPRPVTPMMTSRFYDLPILHRLMVSFGVISVSEKAIKKEAPEIQAAIAALDRGECLVIFPEGYLRRTEEQPLRRFGQGIWQVLQARPDTPIYACWIEGGWGSYTSYFNGKPTKNKKLEFRRPIGVAVSPATTIPTDLLSSHMRTRYHLMNLVGSARPFLGLPALPPFELPAKEDGNEGE